MSTPINPYLNRTAIKDDRGFFGRRRELATIFSRIDAREPQSVSIVGERRIGKSSLLRKLNQKDYAGCAAGFLAWNKAGGKVSKGLAGRRQAEKTMFLTPNKDSAAAPLNANSGTTSTVENSEPATPTAADTHLEGEGQ